LDFVSQSYGLIKLVFDAQDSYSSDDFNIIHDHVGRPRFNTNEVSARKRIYAAFPVPKCLMQKPLLYFRRPWNFQDG